MCGMTSEITSPSVRSTSRSTPCVLGCCGPMLTSISSVRTSNSITVGSWEAVAMIVSGQEKKEEGERRKDESGSPSLDLSFILPPLSFDSTATDAVVFQGELVVLAQRVAHPVFRQEDAAQVRVAGEPDAGQVVNLALVPVGRSPEGGDRRHLGQLARLVAI